MMNLINGTGELIAQRYRILEPLGEGSSGVTYCAEHLETGDRVALKVLSLRNQAAWKNIELFEREAQVLAQLQHPGIPQYREYFSLDTEIDRTFCIAQQLAEGETLAQWVDRGWHGTEADIKQIALQILNILIYLHQLKPLVIHRDIKPQNILLNSSNTSEDSTSQKSHFQVSLVDFGAVQQTYQSTLARGSTIVGTFGYMAPEQYRGKSVPATDLYGLGATILFLLTHRSPSELPVERLKIQFRDRVSISPHFADWLEKLLEPDLKHRFASARDALKALEKRQITKSRSLKLPRTVLQIGIASVAIVLGTVTTLDRFKYTFLEWVEKEPVEVVKAIESGDVTALRYYLDRGGNANYIYREIPLLYLAFTSDRFTFDRKAEALKLLLERGANVNLQLPDGTTILHQAIFYSSYWPETTTKLLLSPEANVNLLDKNGSTLLHWAASVGHLEIMEVLINKGADVNALDSNDSTPLHSAAASGNPKSVMFLLSKGASVSIRDRNGRIPLYWATKSRNLMTITLVSGHKTDVNVRDKFGSTPLHWAVESVTQTPPGNDSSSTIIDFLVQRGASIDSRDNYGSTPLHWAAASEDLEAIEFLVSRGADVNAVNHYGSTPLHWAAFAGKLRSIERLNDKGSHLDLRDKNGKTAIQLAVKAGKDEAVEQLKSYEAKESENFSAVKSPCQQSVNPNIRGNRGSDSTAIHAAAGSGNLKAIEFLAKNGADLNVRDTISGATPLHWAAHYRQFEALKLLANKGADLNARTIGCRTILHWAAASGDLKSIEFLVDRGIDVNAKDELNSTPLHSATGGKYAGGPGSPEAIELLIQKGADVNVRDSHADATTPLGWAIHSNKTQAIEMLKRHGAIE